jgi:hypothetical protein
MTTSMSPASFAIAPSLGLTPCSYPICVRLHQDRGANGEVDHKDLVRALGVSWNSRGPSFGIPMVNHPLKLRKNAQDRQRSPAGWIVYNRVEPKRKIRPAVERPAL